MDYIPTGYNGQGLPVQEMIGTTADITSGTYPEAWGYSYDAANRVTQQRLQMNGSFVNGGSYYANVNRSYDVDDNITSHSEYNSSLQSTYVNDDYGREDTETSLSGNESYTYDADGNVITATFGDGTTLLAAYDALGRLTTRQLSRSGAATETITYTYDSTSSSSVGVGRLSSYTDSSGSTSFVWDRRGFVTSKTQVIGGKTFTTSYTYDSDGNILTLTYPSGRVVNYTYDYADRPATIATSATKYVTAVSYKPFGPTSSISFGNGLTQVITSDQTYSETEDSLSNGATKLFDFSYGRDVTERVTSVTDKLNASYDATYGYSSGRLESGTTGSALWGNLTVYPNGQYLPYYIAYSNYGGSAVSWYSSMSGNGEQPTSVQGPNGTSNDLFDAAGNETQFGSSDVYTYSTRGLLLTANGTTYSYDGTDQRVSAVNGSVTREYNYDSNGNLLNEANAGSSAYDYIYLGDAPIAQEDIGGKTHWTASDYLDAPLELTNLDKSVYWQADYAPFGNVYALRAGGGHQPLRRLGQEAEQLSNANLLNGDSDRFYNGGRWYRPDLGRYAESDPLGYISGGGPGGYSYVLDDPLNSVDENGERGNGTRHPTGPRRPPVKTGFNFCKVLQFFCASKEPMKTARGFDGFTPKRRDSIPASQVKNELKKGKQIFAKCRPGYSYEQGFYALKSYMGNIANQLQREGALANGDDRVRFDPKDFHGSNIGHGAHFQIEGLPGTHVFFPDRPGRSRDVTDKFLKNKNGYHPLEDLLEAGEEEAEDNSQPTSCPRVSMMAPPMMSTAVSYSGEGEATVIGPAYDSGAPAEDQ